MTYTVRQTVTAKDLNDINDKMDDALLTYSDIYNTLYPTHEQLKQRRINRNVTLFIWLYDAYKDFDLPIDQVEIQLRSISQKYDKSLLDMDIKKAIERIIEIEQ